MADPRLLVKRYNQTAAEQNATAKEAAALWSAELRRQLRDGRSEIQ